MVFIDGSLTIL